MISTAEFCEVWARWDERHDEDRTKAMETACKAAAEDLGLDTSGFRDILASARRLGVDRPECLLVARFAAGFLK